MNARKLSTILLLAACTACADDETATFGDFFPLIKDSSWSYVWENNCEGCDSREANAFIRVGNDTTLLDGKTYTKLYNQNEPIRYVRREGSRYYERSIYEDDETLFLDASWTAGLSRVVYQDDYWRDEIVVEKKRSVLLIKDKTYHNVMVIRHDRFYKDDSYEFYYYIRRYYASGTGEVMVEYSPTPYMYIGGMKYSLLQYEH